MLKNGTKSIYICGKVSDLPYEEVKKKFADAAAFAVEELGFKRAINPLSFNAANTPWPEAMKRCIGNLVQCSAIYMLPDWPQSRGAVLERFIASNLGLEIIDAK